MQDYIVLVNEQNEPIGTMEKLAAHNAATPLHRGFSLFLFNKKGELLLQQRSRKKKTWPGIWSNSVCGHPREDEPPILAAQRRLVFELGMKADDIRVVLPDYRYRFMKDNIVENEFCPVMIGTTSDTPNPNPDEVEAVRWVTWNAWVATLAENLSIYSPWSQDETQLLALDPEFQNFLESLQRR